MADTLDIMRVLTFQGSNLECPSLLECFKRREKINGIRNIRSQLEIGLREAKDLYDELEALFFKGVGVYSHPRVRLGHNLKLGVLKPGELSPLVHAAKSVEASRLNAEGTEAQIDFLWRFFGGDKLRELLPHLFPDDIKSLPDDGL